MDIIKKTYNILLAFAALFLLASCWDEDFSTSSSHRLSFEQDTLSLDTVFSTIPSPSKQLKVYNRSGKSVNVKSVRLVSGNQSGFRVNVNGMYLGPHCGYATEDIPLYKGDSIRLFVEMTSRMQKKNVPFLVEDHLLFTLESGVEQRLNLRAWSWDAYVLRGTVINNDTIIANTDDMPVVVYDSLRVRPNATLTIAPGTTIYFHHSAGVDVEGRLIAKGEMGKEITLRCDRLDRMVSNLTYDNNPGQWGGIRLRPESYDNVIAWTDLHGASTGVQCDSAHDMTREKLLLDHTTIHNLNGYGVQVENSKLTINNTQISNAQKGCVDILGGDVSINGSSLLQYYPFDSSRGPALGINYGLAEDTTIVRPLKVRVNNSMLKGYEDDVIMWSYGGKVQHDPYDVLFEHCLLRTPMPTDNDSIFFAGKNNILEKTDDPNTAADSTFCLFDTENFFYDFTPKPQTAVIGAASTETSLPTDRRGKERNKSNPTIGCFEPKE